MKRTEAQNVRVRARTEIGGIEATARIVSFKRSGKEINWSVTLRDQEQRLHPRTLDTRSYKQASDWLDAVERETA